MFDWRKKEEWLELFRYYVAGVANLIFSYILFAALIALGLNAFVAQALGYIVGVAFNFFTYSRYTFSDKKANKSSYILSYVANYVSGVALLWIGLKMFHSPYLAGLAATISVSLLNYLVLKRLVFRESAKA